MPLNERPIFVIGAQRSGTTLLRYMLCGHPRIYIPPESNFIPRFFRRFPHLPMTREQAVQTARSVFGYQMFFEDWRGERPDSKIFVDSLRDLTPASFLDSLYTQYAAQHRAERWGDKSPIYAECMDLLAEMFPRAQFVHIIRDGRDVALSMLQAYRERRFFYVDLYYAAQTWKRRVSKARTSGQKLGPDRYYELRYEKLTAETETVLRGICRFLGEVYTPAMCESQRVAVEHYHSTGIHVATREPPTTRSVGRWRTEMKPCDQRLVQTVAGEMLKELAYDHTPGIRLDFGEKLRYSRLRTKYGVVSSARHVLKSVGLFHPTWLLSGRL